MNLQRVKEIIVFIESLNATEAEFVKGLFVENKQGSKPMKQYPKRQKYSKKQIKKGWKLLLKGYTGKEIAKATGIKRGSASRFYLGKRIKQIEGK
jgi:predicted deacetylase